MTEFHECSIACMWCAMRGSDLRTYCQCEPAWPTPIPNCTGCERPTLATECADCNHRWSYHGLIKGCRANGCRCTELRPLADWEVQIVRQKRCVHVFPLRGDGCARSADEPAGTFPPCERCGIDRMDYERALAGIPASMVGAVKYDDSEPE